MIPPEKRVQAITECLQTALSPLQLEVIDDSHLHAGHTGHQGAGHFTINIVSKQFAGKSLIERHRMVFDALEPLMKTSIHALRINAKEPK